jgi:hypothetical protein
MRNIETFAWIWGVISVGFVIFRIATSIITLKGGRKIEAPAWFWVLFVAAFFAHIYFITRPLNATRHIERYISEYIDHSVEIEIDDIGYGDILGCEFGEIYTGLNFRGPSRSRLSGVPNNYFDFYSGDYNKYFRLLFVDSAESMTIYESNMKNKLLKAKVNQSQLNDPGYGTSENPIPVLYLDIPKYRRSPHYWMIEKSPEEYREDVYYYLAYIMPKDEFKRRFSPVNH